MCQLVARAGLDAVADDRRDDQVRVVERGPAGVRQDVPEFPPSWIEPGFPGCSGCRSARERELFEKPASPPRPRCSPGTPRSKTPPGNRDRAHPRPVPRAGHVDHVQVVGLDRPAQVDVAERQPRAGPPVAEQPILDLLRFEWLLQERIRLQVGHAEGQVVASPPVSVDLAELVRAERRAGYRGRPCRTR